MKLTSYYDDGIIVLFGIDTFFDLACPKLARFLAIGNCTIVPQAARPLAGQRPHSCHGYGSTIDRATEQ
jgi:hypothetical protein